MVPSYADLWVIQDNGVYMIDAIRNGSPAEDARVRPGEQIVSVDGQPVSQAVSAFWTDLGLPVTGERAAFAGRVLAAGRRDRRRRLGVLSAGRVRILDLPNLYSTPRVHEPLVTVTHQAGSLIVRFNDSLGNNATIAAFDAAMAGIQIGQPVVIDLRNTPSGGNTTVARATLGWFVDEPPWLSRA